MAVPRADMRALSLALIALAMQLTIDAAGRAATLGNPQVGFSADRILVFNGHSYVGRMWNMPGEQRHEQDLPSVNPVFILRADSTVGDILLPRLHTAIEFVLPGALSVLGQSSLLGKAVGQGTVNGFATTKYAVDKDIPEGHLSGLLWLSRDGIPMRCDGSFARKNGKVSWVHWELSHVAIGNQDPTLFEVPPGYSKLPPGAAATLLGLRLPVHSTH
jgi:hypothetical protein